MLTKLKQLPRASATLPFVRMSYGSPSQYRWQDDEGHTHMIQQGEGGEQGDPLMPALFALAQHDALVEAAGRLNPADSIFYFLDDLYIVTTKARASGAFRTVAEEVGRGAGVQIHLGAS